MLAEVNGAVIAYDEEGNGPPIIFIHAGIADRSMWDAQIACFSVTHRVIRFDLRGHGESSLPAMPFSNLEDARTLLDLLAVDQVTVVGISMGGDVALDFSLAYPERVARLVLVSTLAMMDEPSKELKANWDAAEAAFELGDLDAATELEVEGWIIGTGRSADAIDTAFRAKATEMIRGYWKRVASMESEVEELELDPPYRDRLGEVKVPTLLALGDHDFPDVPISMDWLHQGIAGSKLVVIQNSAHLPPLEHPDQFNEILTKFLSDN